MRGLAVAVPVAGERDPAVATRAEADDLDGGVGGVGGLELEEGVLRVVEPHRLRSAAGRRPVKRKSWPSRFAA